MKIDLFGFVLQDKTSYEVVTQSVANCIELNKEKDAMLDAANTRSAAQDAALTSQIAEVEKLKAQLTIKEEENVLEKKWNTKRPQATISYLGRSIPGKKDKYKIDVRDFYMPQDAAIPVIKGQNCDEIAISALKYVYGAIKYLSDKENTGIVEYWQFAFETLALKEGDCEDGAILLANIMLKSGIPYWRIRLNAGDVNGGGHAYVTYLALDGKWYVLDWCYWYEDSLSSFGVKEFQAQENYFGIWFSWNQLYAFYDMQFTDAANDRKHKQVFKDIIFETNLNNKNKNKVVPARVLAKK